MAQHLRTTNHPKPEMIVAKETIDKQAKEAAQQGKSLNDACPYPFATEAGRHFAAVFAVAQSQRMGADAPKEHAA